MKKMQKSFKAFGAAALLAGSLAFSVPAVAQVSSLSEVLRKVEADSNQLDAEGRERVARFQRERDEQAAAMREARAELRAAEVRGAQLNAQFDRNEAELAELSAELNEQAGDLASFWASSGQPLGKPCRLSILRWRISTIPVGRSVCLRWLRPVPFRPERTWTLCRSRCSVK